MKLLLKDLNKAISDAKKCGVSGKGAIVIIYSHENGSSVAVYTDKAEFITDIEVAWEKEDKNMYVTYLESVPDTCGELEFTKDTLKVNGPVDMDLTYDAYKRLQDAPPAERIILDLGKSTINPLDVTVDNADLKTMIGLADTKNYIVIGENFMGCSPTPGYGSFVLQTETNKGINTPICLTKNGAKVLSKSNLIPRQLTVYNRTYGQIGAKIDNMVYTYQERLRDTSVRGNDRSINLLDADTTIRLTEVVKNTMTAFGRLEEHHNPTIRLPIGFIEMILKIKPTKSEISFRGVHGQKDITVKTLGTTYTVLIAEPLNKDLDMHLDLRFLQRYLKPMKKYGGTITYNNDKYEAKFTYDGIKLKAGLLGIRPPQGSR